MGDNELSGSVNEVVTELGACLEHPISCLPPSSAKTCRLRPRSGRPPIAGGALELPKIVVPSPGGLACFLVSLQFGPARLRTQFEGPMP